MKSELLLLCTEELYNEYHRRKLLMARGARPLPHFLDCGARHIVEPPLFVTRVRRITVLNAHMIAMSKNRSYR